MKPGMKRSRAFWVIIDGTTPTAFRARDRETLLPTLRQLQNRRPDVKLRWFERNRIWMSPEEAGAAGRVRTPSGPKRGRDWRPGGEHADPRAKYQITRDQKRARFKQRQRAPLRPGTRKPDEPE